MTCPGCGHPDHADICAFFVREDVSYECWCRIKPGELDLMELNWWREFALKITADSQMPKVGGPLLGTRYRVEEVA